MMDVWLEQGSRSYEERLVKEAQRILETHTPQLLSSDVAARINEIAVRADDALARIEFTA